MARAYDGAFVIDSICVDAGSIIVVTVSAYPSIFAYIVFIPVLAKITNCSFVHIFAIIIIFQTMKELLDGFFI